METGGSGGASPVPARLSREEPGESGEPARVLVVDDDPNDLRYVRDTLVNAGYLPIVTGDPEEALRIMEQERPELALLDLMLPDTDGIELMGAILGLADLPVIFLSAYGREEQIARGPGDGGRRLRGQAFLAHGVGGQDQGGPAAAGRLPNLWSPTCWAT